MIKLDTPVQYIKGVGPKVAKKLAKLGVIKVSDMLNYHPRAWLDFSAPTPIFRARIGEVTVVRGRLDAIKTERSPRKRMAITRAFIVDNSGKMSIIWFNQPYLANSLKIGESYYFYGRVGYDFALKTKLIQGATIEREGKILSIYNETKGLNSRYLRKIVQNIIAANPYLDDFLPEEILKAENLIGQYNALQQIHFPRNSFYLARAKERLAFNEVFLLVLKMLVQKKEISCQLAPNILVDKSLLKKFVDELPYKLTNAQKKASWEIIRDLSGQRITNHQSQIVNQNNYAPYAISHKPQAVSPMNRLLEGDVGSGKTIVAAMAALLTIKSHYKVVWMAPTEILANQHYKNVSQLLKPYQIRTALFTHSQIEISDIKDTKMKKKFSKNQLKSLAVSSDLIIGTHALIQDSVKFDNLGLVIIDEQHRFGVRQRAALRTHEKPLIKTPSTTKNICVNQCRYPGKSAESVPHFLSMTATPIPRSLALVFYGDLNISILDELPSGRARTITRLVNPTNRDKAYDFIRGQVKMGRQIFVVCPLIETKELKNKETPVVEQSSLQGKAKKQVNLFEIDRKSAKKEYEKLSKEIFPNLRIALLHGKMKGEEKEKTMAAFRRGDFDILVSTSIIEVGIDISNATVMMVENAERFGLSQLHQFRGRVGRGRFTSYCLLFTDSLSEQTKRRLQCLEEITDGFNLAEKDLEWRGPGELSGASQHGMPDLKMASITDTILIKRARTQAEAMVEEGLEKYPKIKRKIEEFDLHYHLE